jgi:hypothetical protein
MGEADQPHLRDLPSGFAQGPPPTSPGDPTWLTCGRFSPDLSRFTITGEAVSRQFVRGKDTSVFSSAGALERSLLAKPASRLAG